MAVPKLETDRLILKEIYVDNVDIIFNCWVKDEDVSKYMYWKADNNINDRKESVELELGNNLYGKQDGLKGQKLKAERILE